MSWHLTIDHCPACASPRTLQISLPDHHTAAAIIDCLDCGTRQQATIRLHQLTGRRITTGDITTVQDVTAPGAALIAALMQRGTP